MSEGLTPARVGSVAAPPLSPSANGRSSVPSTVLLLNPLEVQAEFLAVANQLSTPGPSPHSTYTTLLLHAFQATFGPHCDLPGLHCRLQVCAWGPGLSSAPSQQKFSLLPFGACPDTLAPLTLSEVAGALTSLRGLCSAGS